MNITILNGGNGAKNIIQSLINNDKFKITSIVNTFDDGKSTGTIREFFNMPGPSDIRKVHYLYLNKYDSNYLIYKKLYRYRFTSNKRIILFNQFKNYFKLNNNKLFGLKFNDIKINNFIKKNLIIFFEYLLQSEKINNKLFNFYDCSLINCIYAGSFIDNKRSISSTIRDFEKIFQLKGKVISISNQNLFLSGLTANNKILKTEESIIKNKYKKKITNLFLTKIPLKKIISKKESAAENIKILMKNHINYKISLLAKKCILKTDILIFAPGTQFSSLYPTYMSKGLKKTLFQNKKILKILFINILRENDTYNFKIIDFINESLNYLSIFDANHREDFFKHILINKFNDNKKKNKFIISDLTNTLFDKKIIVDKFADKNFLHSKKKIYDLINKLKIL